jgi:hypothetical protein
MAAIRWLLRAVAFVFNLGLALFLLALVALSGWQHNIQFPGAVFEGEKLTYAVLGAGAYALLAVLLAARKSRAARLPMLLWNILIPLDLIAAPFRSGFSFESRDHLITGMCLLAAALAALKGSWLHFSQPARRGGSAR